MNLPSEDPAPLPVLDSKSILFEDRKRPLLTAAIILLASVAAVTSAWLCQVMLGRMPHVPDEISYLFQARLLATGRLWAAPPPLPDLFSFDHIVLIPGRWCSIYPPGWPLVLALGWIIHAAWIMNPLLLAASVIGTWKLAAQLYDSRTAWLSALLFACSPFVLLMNAGFMSHPASLCCAVWGTSLFVRGYREKRVLLSVAAGTLVGFCFLIRPYTAIVLLWPLLLWPLIEGKDFRVLLRVAAGFLPFLLLFLVYNWTLFGNPLRTGYSYDPAFHPGGISRELIWNNAVWYFQSFDRWLWRWPWPNLLIFLPLVWQRNRWKESAFLAISSVSLVAGHCLYYFRDIVYGGPRYAFEAMPFLSILAAQGLNSMMQWLAPLKPRARFAVTAIAAFALAAFSISHLPEDIAFHSQMYHSRSHKLVAAVRSSQIGSSALIFQSGNPYVFGSFLLENTIDPEEGGRVFVRDIPAEEEAAIQAFPRKEVWRMHIDMTPIAGPNSYPDRWKLTQFDLKRLR